MRRDFITRDPVDLGRVFGVPVDPACGALALFTGTVRNHSEGKNVKALFYDCYVGLAERQIERIVAAARKDHGVDVVFVQHRIGWLKAGDIAVVIAVRSAHRGQAFSACRWILEEIKRTVPIWKKEIFDDGTGAWFRGCCEEEAVK